MATKSYVTKPTITRPNSQKNELEAKWKYTGPTKEFDHYEIEWRFRKNNGTVISNGDPSSTKSNVARISFSDLEDTEVIVRVRAVSGNQEIKVANKTSSPSGGSSMKDKILTAKGLANYNGESSTDGTGEVNSGVTYSTKQVPYWTCSWVDNNYPIKRWDYQPSEPTIEQDDVRPQYVTATVEGIESAVANVFTHVEFMWCKYSDRTKVVGSKKAKITRTGQQYEGYASIRVTLPTDADKYIFAARYVQVQNSIVKHLTDWSAYTSPVLTPLIKTANIASVSQVSINETVSPAQAQVQIKIESIGVSKATYYYQYTDNKNDFLLNDLEEQEIKNYALTDVIGGMEAGKKYYFRARVANESTPENNKQWSTIKTIVIGTKPGIPTTFSAVTRAPLDDYVNLYWNHNSSDNSWCYRAEIEVVWPRDGSTETFLVPSQSREIKKEDAPKSYSLYLDGDKADSGDEIKWRVRTKGIYGYDRTDDVGWSDWSMQRSISVYSVPSITITGPSPITFMPAGIVFSDDAEEDVVSYSVSVIAQSNYEANDKYGNIKTISAGDSIYQEVFAVENVGDDHPHSFNFSFDPRIMTITNYQSYVVKVDMSFASGVTASAESMSMRFEIENTDTAYPDIEMELNPNDYSMFLIPKCSKKIFTAHPVSYDAAEDKFIEDTTVSYAYELNYEDGIPTNTESDVDGYYIYDENIDAPDDKPYKVKMENNPLTEGDNPVKYGHLVSSFPVREATEHGIYPDDFIYTKWIFKAYERTYHDLVRPNAEIKISPFTITYGPDPGDQYSSELCATNFVFDFCDDYIKMTFVVQFTGYPDLDGKKCTISAIRGDDIGRDIVVDRVIGPGPSLLYSKPKIKFNSDIVIELNDFYEGGIDEGAKPWLVDNCDLVVADYTSYGGEEGDLYTIVDEDVPTSDYYLSVYRINYDDTLTMVAENLDSEQTPMLTDPHPSLDYARYRIVAISKKTGEVTYSDSWTYPVRAKTTVLQWDETVGTLDVSDFSKIVGLYDVPVTTAMLFLPYNLNVSESVSVESTTAQYIGRQHPVAYFGTAITESQNWSVDVPKADKVTIELLRRLAKWNGPVYAREPSGAGYWSLINVSFDINHCEVVIPVSLTITRIDGGL